MPGRKGKKGVPRRAGRARARGPARGGGSSFLSTDSSTVSCPFRHVVTTSMSGAAVTISGLDLTPASFTGSRLASLFANWEYFRFMMLRMTAFVSFGGVSLLDSSVSHVTSGGTRTAVAFAEDGTAGVTAPTTLEAMAQMSGFAVGAGTQNRCTLSVGAQQLLRRELKWWKTDTGGSPPASFLSQGSLWWMYDNDASWSGVGGVITFVLEGVCQFQGMTVAGVGSHNPLCRLIVNGQCVQQVVPVSHALGDDSPGLVVVEEEKKRDVHGAECLGAGRKFEEDEKTAVPRATLARLPRRESIAEASGAFSLLPLPLRR